MGSLRNPIGPLPSSIYWRRRAILLTLVGLLALLIVWVVTSGGGNGDNNAGEPNGKNPATSITPGPSGSGPAISEAPGGRDESGDESGSGGDSSGTGSTSGSGSDADSGAGGADGGSGAAGGGTSDGGGKNGSSSGEQVPADSPLPNCAAGAVELTVRSVRNAYEPGVNPTFELIARNSSGSDCKLDLGPDNTVVTITAAGADDAFWASDHCHETAGSLLFKVPAGDRVTYTVEWNRDPSAPNCATPSAGSAAAGTYLVEAKAPGLATARQSFVLEKD